MSNNIVSSARLRRLPNYLRRQAQAIGTIKAVPANENRERATSVWRKSTQTSGSSIRIEAQGLPNWISGVIRPANELGDD